jgi:triphosphoribosyl-dephospho-CoA synthase
MTASGTLSIGQCATIACLLEVTAPKPGNVHRGADFEDVTFLDFAISAAVLGPIFERAGELGVGKLVLEGVRATQLVVNTNTNLGLLLLMAPLAKIFRGEALQDGAARVLGSLTQQDAADVYAAIGLANPGGLGKVKEHDVSATPPSDLLAAMQLAAERDLIAKQYVTAFADLDSLVACRILERIANGWRLTDAIVHTHVQLMAERLDSLIARKCGTTTSEKSAWMAQAVLDSGSPGDDDYHEKLADLDFWLRSDGHRRNPGTTADMIGAGLFWLLKTGQIAPPFA